MLVDMVLTCSLLESWMSPTGLVLEQGAEIGRGSLTMVSAAGSS